MALVLAKTYGLQLADLVGRPNADLGCLRAADGSLLTGWGEKLLTDLFGGFLGAMAPNVDGKLVPALPLDAMRAGMSANIPVMLGVTADESSSGDRHHE